MATQSEPEAQVDELEDVQTTEGDESTDWKSEHQKLTEKAIRSRERSKALRDQNKALQAQLDEARKSPAAPPPANSEQKPDDSNLLQKAFLRSAGISAEDEVDLALSTAKKWDMQIDKLVDDEDFQAKLTKLRTEKANVVATSGPKGGAGSSQAKNTPAYWIEKGTPPTAADVPDRGARAKIVRAMMANAKTGGKKFYND